MAASRRVWLCTEECSFVPADRITALSIRSREGGPLAQMPDGDVRLTVRTGDGAGNGEGPYTTVLVCPSDRAPALLADLARVLTDAVDYPEQCAFVHVERPDGERAAWVVSSGPPENWPG